MKFVQAKHLLSNWVSGENWFGTNYNMNIYRGCCHGCIYCDSRSSCYEVKNFDEVRAKENSLNILEAELKSKRKKGVVGTGSMSDPYNPFEKEYELSRGALKLIDKYGFGAGFLTKSPLAVRDIDILVKIKEHSPVMVNYTITTYDDDLCKMIEPNVLPSSERFKAVKKFSDAGIFTGVLAWPTLPFINDNEENIKSLVREAARCNASFIIPCFAVTLRDNQRLYFYDQLDKKFPGLKKEYIKTFKDSYVCTSPNEKNLKNAFVSECKKYNLIYKMSDIVTKFKSNYENKQISFF